MKNILFYKLILVNSLAILWLGGTNHQTQWFSNMFQSDTTKVTWGIAALFVAVWCATWYVGKGLNIAYNRGASYNAKGLEWIGAAGGWMLFLGLIGTLLGLQISLSGVNTGNLGNLEGIKSLAVQMIGGLRIELSATILGAIFALWTEVNYVILKHTADKGVVQ